LSNLPNTPKEKRRWSFRRSSAAASPSKDLNSSEQNGERTPVVMVDNLDSEDEQKKHLRIVATAAAAAVAAAQAAAAVMRLTAAAAATGRASAVEEAAAIKIQSVFRGYLVCNFLSIVALS